MLVWGVTLTVFLKTTKNIMERSLWWKKNDYFRIVLTYLLTCIENICDIVRIMAKTEKNGGSFIKNLAKNEHHLIFGNF